MYKRIDFTKTGGFPLTQDSMAFLQDSYEKVFSGVAQALGKYNILTGTTIVSGNYTNGWLTYNGELLPFVGCPVSQGTDVIIVQSAVTLTYRDSTMNQVVFTRYTTLGSGGVPISSFSRNTLDTLNTGVDNAINAANNAQTTANTALANSIPSGVILMWSGSVATIPAGWKLCNGTSGTPNLQDLFIVGAGNTYTPGATGGANTVTLNTTQIPSHSHTVNDPGHKHDFQTGGDNLIDDTSIYIQGRNNADGRVRLQSSVGYYPVQNANTGISLSNTGGGAAHENRPPFYALCYIMKS